MSVESVLNTNIVPKIGLETHVKLNTGRKLFCSCPAVSESALPNALTCLICLGFPGSKPRLNRTAFEQAVKIALVLNCRASPQVVFSRKTYYYPDLAKNYQITQFESPIGFNGVLDAGDLRVVIQRVQLEEDPAQVFYKQSMLADEYSLLDYSRSGTALCEIVTAPCFTSASQAREYLKMLFKLLSYLGLVDKEVEAVLRTDANVSIQGGERVEIKNITGFQAVEKAIEGEIIRQTALVGEGKKIERETRGFLPTSGTTITLRKKEEESDYGYIIEPDLPIVLVTPEYLQALKQTLPQLPDETVRNFVSAYGVTEKQARVLVYSGLASFFTECHALYPTTSELVKWCVGDLLKCLHYQNKPVEECVTPQAFADFLHAIDDGKITQRAAKELIKDLVGGKAVSYSSLSSLSPSSASSQASLEQSVQEAIAENPRAVEDYRQGKKTALNYLLGVVVKKHKGQVDVNKTRATLEKMLNG